MITLDASIALSWCFADESSPESDEIAQQVIKGGAIVPAIFHLELANVLLQSEKRGRLTRQDSAARLQLIGQLPIQTDPQLPSNWVAEILELARANSLTSYDAAYLELAMRVDVPLATKDKALITASRKLGVIVLSAP